MEVPQPSEPATPVVPDAPVQPAVPEAPVQPAVPETPVAATPDPLPPADGLRTSYADPPATPALSIAGAARGIGVATAQRFAAAGDRVVTFSRSRPADADAAGEWIQLDACDWDGVHQAVDGVRERYGSVDVVIANAGLSTRRRFADTTREDFRALLEPAAMRQATEAAAADPALRRSFAAMRTEFTRVVRRAPSQSRSRAFYELADRFD